jgi:polyhydroxyalkanoate synthesis regulator phasin
MAHMLNFNKRTGTWSFASNSEVAWHGLGQVVKGAMTAEEAIKNANLDYEVDKAKVQFFPATDKQIWVEGHYATYRKDTYDYLGMVKSRYEIVQNRDAFGFFDSIIDEGEAIFETAGALGNGEKIEKYIMLTNSHDGSSSVIAGMTNIRVVCNNTLQAALKGLENKVSINHISGAKDKLKEAHRVMGIASNYSNQVQDIFNQMADRKMTEGQYRDYFEAIFTPEYKTAMTAAEEKEMSTRLKNMIEGTTQFAFTHPTQTTDAANGTLWGAYNAVSGYYNYIKTFKSTEDKFNSQFFGVANKKMLKSFNQAVALIND